MSKSEKLYKDSPAIKKDGDGKPGVQRPSKADTESLGTEGNPIPGDEDGMPLQVKQTHDMHERHIQEMKDMHKRHQKEHEKLAADHSGTDEHTNDIGDKTPDKEGTN